MTKRIMNSIAFTAILAVLCSIALIMGFLNSYFSIKTTSGLQTQAELITSAYNVSGKNYFENADFSDTRVTWIDADGTVLFDSAADISKLDNHSGREEVSAAFENGLGTSVRYSDTLLKKNIYCAVKANDGTVIRAATEHLSVWAQMLELLQPLLIILIAVLIAAGFAATKLSGKITKPINEIDLDNPDIDESYSELSPLLHKIKNQNAKINFQMEQLRAAQRQFEEITENMSEGLIIADSSAFVLSCNRSALRLLGAKTNRSERQNILMLNRSEAFIQCVNEALSGRHCEGRLEKGDRVYSIFANPTFESESDGLTGVILFIIDETEKSGLEAMRREFTSNVSLELKTPLTSISGVADMLANGIVKSADVPQFGSNIRSEAERLITLINDIISLSRLDEGNIPVEIIENDLLQKSLDAAKQLEEFARNRNVTVSVSGEHVKLRCNPAMIFEIIRNLCDNAIKYNRDGGTVTVEVREINGNAVITVSDTGIGIPPQDIDRIFERFYRVNKSHSKKIEGTGLGLSIVKHSVKYLGGTVTAESVPEKGSRFTVTLPTENQ